MKVKKIVYGVEWKKAVLKAIFLFFKIWSFTGG